LVLHPEPPLPRELYHAIEGLHGEVRPLGFFLQLLQIEPLRKGYSRKLNRMATLLPSSVYDFQGGGIRAIVKLAF
jgi:hypothetical protein